MAILALLLTSLNVNAELPDVTQPYLDGCPADTVGQPLNCTADDVRVALVTSQDEGVRCITGYPTHVNLETKFEINAGSQRDDVATWIPANSELGKNMLLPSGMGGPSSCLSKAFDFPIYADPLPGEEFPPLVVGNLDKDGDACGDVAGVNRQFTQPFADADVACEGAVGGAEVDALVSWHLSGNDPVCNAHKDYGNFKKSKCSYTTSFVDLVVVGRLEICKSADSTNDFAFNIDGGEVWQAGTGADEVPTAAAGSFVLNPSEPVDGAEACISFDVLTHQPGEGGSNEVTITENPELLPGDFDLTDITCTNNTPGGGPVEFSRDGYSLVIELTEGDLGSDTPTTAGQSDVSCTFINTEGGSLTIFKETLPAGSQQLFTFNQTLDASGSFDLSNGQSKTFDGLNDVGYTVTETLPTGWTLADVTCRDGETALVEGQDFWFNDVDELAIDVSNGENFVCTFHNVQEGRAIVRKEVLPVDDTTEFTFTGDLNGSISGGNALPEYVIAEPPTAEPLTSTEIVPEGWDLDSIVCDDDDSTGSGNTATFNVAPGEVVTCVFTNVKRGNIVVQKNAIGDDGEFSFLTNFAGTVGIDTSVSDTAAFMLSASDEVAETTYSVTEDTSGLERWTYDGSECTSSLGGFEDNDAIDLDPGETVTCVYTNTKWASLTLVKEALVPDDEFCFIEDTPETDPAEKCIVTVDGHYAETWDELPFGIYSLEEIPDDNGVWVLQRATCDNGDNPAAIDIGPGDDVTCTFVNVPAAAVPVNNTVALLLLVLMMLAAAWYFRPEAYDKR